MNEQRRGRSSDERLRIGPSAERLGRSPRMVRYLEDHGVLRPERGPGPGGHRHFAPPELALGAAAAQALDAGYASGVLRALRELADRRVAAALSDADPLAWFELLAINRAVEAQVHDRFPPPPPHGPRPAAELPPPPRPDPLDSGPDVPDEADEPVPEEWR
jgi:DNA-binding transcriptional MerR regulator